MARAAKLGMLMVGADPRTLAGNEEMNPREKLRGHKPPRRLLMKNAGLTRPRLQEPRAHVKRDKASPGLLTKTAHARQVPDFGVTT